MSGSESFASATLFCRGASVRWGFQSTLPIGKPVGGRPFYQPHQIRDCLSNSLCSPFDVSVSQMSVSERHADIGMSEQPRDYRDRHAVHHREARVRVAYTMYRFRPILEFVGKRRRA